jgi:hypothetical protein
VQQAARISAIQVPYSSSTSVETIISSFVHLYAVVITAIMSSAVLMMYNRNFALANENKRLSKCVNRKAVTEIIIGIPHINL